MRQTLGTGMMAPLSMANNFVGNYYAGPSGWAMGAMSAADSIADGLMNLRARQDYNAQQAQVQAEKDRARMDELNQRQAVAQAINPFKAAESSGMGNRDMSRRSMLPDAGTQMTIYKMQEDRAAKEQAALDEKYSSLATYWFTQGGHLTDPTGENFKRMTGSEKSPFEYIKESVYNAAENRELRRDLAAQSDQTRRELAAAVQAGKTPAAPKRELFVDPRSGKYVWVNEGEDIPQGLVPHTNNMGVTVNSDGSTVINTGGAGKSIPTAAVASLTGNFSTLNRIDESLSEIDKAPFATNYFKGTVNEYAPNLVNRIDPDGAQARAAIGDLGSTVIHDRSGAAVTASEYPRLRPFIPTAYDDADTVKMKLKRFKQIVEEETRLYADNFSPEMGYRRPGSWGKYLDAQPVAEKPVANKGGAPSGGRVIKFDANGNQVVE